MSLALPTGRAVIRGNLGHPQFGARTGSPVLALHDGVEACLEFVRFVPIPNGTQQMAKLGICRSFLLYAIDRPHADSVFD